VAQPVDQGARQVGELADSSPQEVLVEDGDDLVVRLAAVEHRQPADDPRREDDLGSRDRSLGEDADVEGIAVALDGSWHQAADLVAAVGAGNETVERGRQRRGALRAIDAQISARLVDLVLDEVEWRDLDEGVDDRGRLRPGVESMPGVGTEPLKIAR
jgi:hypothetical protein